MAGGQCRTEISILGMALDGLVFKRMSVTSPHQCEVHCEREITCQSYNYVIGEKNCELNNRTKEARPQNFRSDTARFYKRRSVDRVPLGSIPELPAVSCQEIQASEGKYNISNKYWLDTRSTGQAEMVDCSDSVKVCDTNPCKNGGTCVAAPSAKIYKCKCTDTFTGINCSEPKPVV
ncbi:neurogenic locus Notch protein-like [Stylophora pistillata]|uniref:neurogenic locus Notch protein-like n=1 Tax=Stylophora pistillata TaxID=50429 RepID=UPI000C04502C|nr:neurogenic locus Notch protein-like [Stylophora pistillata]